MAKQTPSQTVGPYFAYGLTPEQYGYAFTSIAGPVLTTDEADGERIVIEDEPGAASALFSPPIPG